MIDLSPQNNCIWGDYARTLIVENGRIVKDIEQIQNNEWRDGLKMETYLHQAMLGFVNKNTTFEELFYYINDQIKARGYVNLDFLGNLGHSIVKDKRQRIVFVWFITTIFSLMRTMILSTIRNLCRST